MQLVSGHAVLSVTESQPGNMFDCIDGTMSAQQRSIRVGELSRGGMPTAGCSVKVAFCAMIGLIVIFIAWPPIGPRPTVNSIKSNAVDKVLTGKFVAGSVPLQKRSPSQKEPATSLESRHFAPRSHAIDSSRPIPATFLHHRRATPMCGSVQVVTDIDDTVKSSGGVAIPLGGLSIPLGGVDTTFKRNSFYPGVFQFDLEIACHATSFGSRPEKVAVLTARAREFLFALEIKQDSKLCLAFREAGESRSMSDWGVGPVLYGSVQEWICQDRKGWRKFENFKQLNADTNQNGQKRYVFVGDNGYSEKDLEAAERIIDAFPGILQAVFLHAVSSDEQPAPLPPDEVIAGTPIRYFRTYSSAAVKAAECGLLGVDGVSRVLDAIETSIEADKLNIPVGGENYNLYVSELAEARTWLASRTGFLGLPAVRGWINKWTAAALKVFRD